MKKVLIITYYWPPAGGGGVQRWVKFVKYLQDFGWEPVVYTVENPDYPILDKSIGEEVPKDIEVLKHPIIEPYGVYKKLTGKHKNEKIDANFLSQGKKMAWKDKLAVWVRGNVFIPDARFLWIKPSVKYLSKFLDQNHIDAIISTGPPHSCHLIAYHIKQKFKFPWIIDYRDPWTQIDYFDDLGLTAWSRKRHITLEKKVLNACDIIVTVGKTMASDLRLLTVNRTEVITNGFDESDRTGHGQVTDNYFSVTYIGTMNDARNPEALWKAVSFLKKMNHPLCKELKVNLVGKPEAIVSDSVTYYNINDLVNFIGYVPHKEAIKYQNAAQILLLIINRTSNNASILTGKIFEYLASGRPVLCIGPNDGDAADIIHEAGAGVVIDYDDVNAVVEYFKQNFERYKSGQLKTQTSGIEKYSRRALTGKYAELLNDIIQHK
ncbi:MAG: glycosyltransferase family 4 protein [Saprospiraceae bacterium]|nr:glycosyltransferase family 4 protein [Saprospiraceae bacterium]MBP6568966.1 glycosyltransferase family 4 protein [Saprospiraceae bacterium]